MLAAGTRLNHYEVRGPLGTGGMGEVYLALDTRLQRRVALKLLPAACASDAARVRRFTQEALAASALNHPNILTVYEVGEAATAGGVAHFIAAEFVEGETLRRHAARRRLPLPAALDIAVQIASALAAAHAAGIVHRDIKPENVIVRRDGIVKVLDFGLAKLSEQRPDGVDSEAPTVAQVKTDPGTVMGTASYMSPEQARGQDVDARSDIFSFGVVLYEMLAGRAPFAGANAIEVLGAILHQEPAPLRAHAPDAPAELQRIVAKALRKDREQRYQHVKDVLIDLSDLRRELEFEEKLKGVQAFVIPASAGSAAPREGPPEGETTNAPPIEAVTNGVSAARPTSSTGVVLGEIRRHKAGVLLSLAALLAAVGLLAYGVYRLTAPKQSAARFQNVKFTRLTAVGDAGRGASISPDGKLICYVLVEGPKFSLWTKAIATGSTVQIVPPTEVAAMGNTTFSPDGNYVFYRVQETDGQSALYQIPALGGLPKKVLTNISGSATFSPDGRQIAFVRSSLAAGGNQLLVANADGSGERILAGQASKLRLQGSPSWSPDSGLIAVGAFLEDRAVGATVLGISVGSGEAKSLTAEKWEAVYRVAWFADGRGLAFAAREANAPNIQIFQLSHPGGEVRRITNDLSNYGTASLSLTADSKALLAVQGQQATSLWAGATADARRARQLVGQLAARDSSEMSPAWVPDGRIVYVSAVSGNQDIWIMNGDGSNPRPLTDSPAADNSPAVSPDGRYVVFMSTRTGKLNLWRMDIDGNNPRQLTHGDVERMPDFSPDGRWVVYDSPQAGGPLNLWKISVDGGSPERLTHTPGGHPAVSPDGRWIAHPSVDRQVGGKSKLVIIPFEGGAPVKTLDFTPLPLRFRVRWSPDARSLLYVDVNQGGANLWRLPLDGGAPQPLTDFKNEQIWSFDITRDGRQFVVARGTTTSDVVLIREVK